MLFVNYLISVLIWVLIAYLFNFSILGWIIGLIISFIYKEFIGPLLIISSGDKIIDSAHKRYENELLIKNNSPLTNNFDYKDSRDINFCISYYHQNKGKISESDIQFELKLYKYKNENFLFDFSIQYDTRKRGDAIEIRFCEKDLNFFDNEVFLNFSRNEGNNALSFFSITPKYEHLKYFIQEGGNLSIVFTNSTETIKITGKLLQAISETYKLGLYLNKI